METFKANGGSARLASANDVVPQQEEREAREDSGVCAAHIAQNGRSQGVVPGRMRAFRESSHAAGADKKAGAGSGLWTGWRRALAARRSRWSGFGHPFGDVGQGFFHLVDQDE
ncbi:MAG: hypothetical protein HGA47_10065, partial [Zoogloea sp.]|nr:hypothetical protein [Zoogloea sp.]